MAKYCEICGKGKVTGSKITFSNKKNKRTWAPNVHKVKVDVNGSPKRMYVCTRCLRSGNVNKAL